MKNLKECYLWSLLIIMLNTSLTSCQRTVMDHIFNNKDVDSSSVALSSLNTSHALAPEQLSTIFPKYLSGLKRTVVKLDQTTGAAIAHYGNNEYEVSITDDLRNNFSKIHLFKRKYKKLSNDITGKRVIKTVRDGYKTIATIESSQITSISFVFKHRYIFKVTGTNKQTPYMVWRFLELNKFHNLRE